LNTATDTKNMKLNYDTTNLP